MDAFEPQAHVFRFYEDGTESGSSPIAAEDINLTARDVNADSQVQLRYGVQEVGSGSIGGASTDDYQLEYLKNGGGGWQTLDAASSNVKADTGSTLSDGSASTDRSTDGIADGNGSFVAGEQEAGDGEIEDHELTADNFTEHVFALTLISADLADADFLDFRLRHNGGAMDNAVTPRITVAKAADVDVDVANATLTVAGKVPTITAPADVAVGKADLSIAGQIPTVTAPADVAVANATLTTAGRVPVITAPADVAVANAALTLTGQVPVVAIAVVVAVGNATLSATGQVPTITAPADVAVANATLTATGQVPVVDISSAGVTVVVPKADLSVTGQVPVVTAPADVAVAKATLTLTGQALTLLETLPVANATLALTGQVPLMSQPTIFVGKAAFDLVAQDVTLAEELDFGPPAQLAITAFIPRIAVNPTANLFELTAAAARQEVRAGRP